jgi:hypothetical protein
LTTDVLATSFGSRTPHLTFRSRGSAFSRLRLSRSCSSVEIVFFHDALVWLVDVSDAILKISAFGGHEPAFAAVTSGGMCSMYLAYTGFSLFAGMKIFVAS